MTISWSGLFGRNQGKKTAQAPIELLSRVPFFEELDNRELNTVEQILHRREYQSGELIFRQGDRGLGMYIIQTGRVEVVSEPENHILSELEDGDFFGEVALLDESNRSATVRAKTDCIVLGFFQPDLNALIARSPKLGLKIVMRIARHACQRLRQSNELVVSLAAELESVKKTASSGVA